MSVHIEARAGDIAERILLPGDPLRAQYMAEHYLQDVVCFNKVRGMLGYTGRFNGQPVSVMGTGMGIPSMSIYATELMQEYGVKTLVRVGTCGSFRQELHVNNVVLAQAACTDSGFLGRIFPGHFAPAADFGLLKKAYEIAERQGLPAQVGTVFTSDVFYSDELAPENNAWVQYGVLAVEMETAALYTLAQKFGRRALAILTVSDSLVADEPILSAEERETALDTMIRLALDTVTDEQHE